MGAAAWLEAEVIYGKMRIAGLFRFLMVGLIAGRGFPPLLAVISPKSELFRLSEQVFRLNSNFSAYHVLYAKPVLDWIHAKDVDTCFLELGNREVAEMDGVSA